MKRKQGTPQLVKRLKLATPTPNTFVKRMDMEAIVTPSISMLSVANTQPKPTTATVPGQARRKMMTVRQFAHRMPNTTTENKMPSYTSTRNARVDLFFGGLVRKASAQKISDLVARAWKENPTHTFQLLLNARDCRAKSKGKGERASVHRLVMPHTLRLG